MQKACFIFVISFVVINLLKIGRVTYFVKFGRYADILYKSRLKIGICVKTGKCDCIVSHSFLWGIFFIFNPFSDNQTTYPQFQFWASVM
jgi:hypothetical protein